jgi:hypothetical protein
MLSKLAATNSSIEVDFYKEISAASSTINYGAIIVKPDY